MIGSSLTVVPVSYQSIWAHSVAAIWAEDNLYLGSVCCSVAKICVQKKRDRYAKNTYIFVTERVCSTSFDVFSFAIFTFSSLVR